MGLKKGHFLKRERGGYQQRRNRHRQRDAAAASEAADAAVPSKCAIFLVQPIQYPFSMAVLQKLIQAPEGCVSLPELILIVCEHRSCKNFQKSKLSQVMLWSWGYISPQLLQHLAALVSEDMALLRDGMLDSSLLDKLARLCRKHVLFLKIYAQSLCIESLTVHFCAHDTESCSALVCTHALALHTGLAPQARSRTIASEIFIAAFLPLGFRKHIAF